MADLSSHSVSAAPLAAVEELYNSNHDTILGSLLTIVSGLGSLLNTISFIYFKTQLSPKGNSGYFRNLYMVITLTDLLICVSLVAVEVSAFSPQRSGGLLDVPGFCLVWGVLWPVLHQLSIFLVGLLSVSRLLVLIGPTRRLPPRLAAVLPAALAAGILGITAAMLISGSFHTVYLKPWIGCTLSVFRTADQTRPLTQRDLDLLLVILMIFSIIPALSVVPITISFSLSLVYLRKYSLISTNITTSNKKQLEAAKTVVLVTLLYLIFNIPYSAALLYRTADTLWVLPEQEVLVRDYISDWTFYPTSYKFINNYGMLMVGIVTVGLNSMINPFVYFFRIGNFKSFVLTQVLRTAVTQVTGEAGNSSRSRDTASGPRSP